MDEVMYNMEKYNVRSPADLLHTVSELQPETAAEFLSVLEDYQFHILINQARSQKDKDLARSISSVSKKYFGVYAEPVGALEYDNAVWQSLRNRKHLLMQNPHSRIYGQLLTVTRSLVDPNRYRKVA